MLEKAGREQDKKEADNLQQFERGMVSKRPGMSKQNSTKDALLMMLRPFDFTHSHTQVSISLNKMRKENEKIFF